MTQRRRQVNVRMSLIALFASTAHQASGQTCNRLDTRYRLVRENGRLVIDSAPDGPAPEAATTETLRAADQRPVRIVSSGHSAVLCFLRAPTAFAGDISMTE